MKTLIVPLLAAALVIACKGSEDQGPPLAEVLQTDGPKIASKIAILETIAIELATIKPTPLQVDGPNIVVAGTFWIDKDKPNAAWIYADDLALKDGKRHHPDRVGASEHLSSCLYAVKKRTYPPGHWNVGTPVPGKSARDFISTCEAITYALVIQPAHRDDAVVDQPLGSFTAGTGSGDVHVYNLTTGKYVGGFTFLAALPDTITSARATDQQLTDKIEEDLHAKLKTAAPGTVILD